MPGILPSLIYPFAKESLHVYVSLKIPRNRLWDRHHLKKLDAEEFLNQHRSMAEIILYHILLLNQRIEYLLRLSTFHLPSGNPTQSQDLD